MKKGLTVVEGADLNGDEHFSCREELSLWCTVNAESLVRRENACVPVCPGFLSLTATVTTRSPPLKSLSFDSHNSQVGSLCCFPQCPIFRIKNLVFAPRML